jgi:glutathione S-transferase
MRLHWSPKSPFVRKVMIVAHEHGLLGRLECVRTVAETTAPSETLMADNPLNKIPTLVLDDGVVLHDSRVICEYFDSLGSGARLFPPSGMPRWEALRRQALGDGLLDFLLLWRQERLRPEELRSEAYLRAYGMKLTHTLDRLEAEAGAAVPASFNIGDVAVGCALAYLDFRFADIQWRAARPRLVAWRETFDARPSAKATAIIDDSATAAP